MSDTSDTQKKVTAFLAVNPDSSTRKISAGIEVDRIKVMSAVVVMNGLKALTQTGRIETDMKHMIPTYSLAS